MKWQLACFTRTVTRSPVLDHMLMVAGTFIERAILVKKTVIIKTYLAHFPTTSIGIKFRSSEIICKRLFAVRQFDIIIKICVFVELSILGFGKNFVGIRRR